MTTTGSANVLLREWEREWLVLEDAIENDSASLQGNSLEAESEGRTLAIAELSVRTKARMLRQLEIVQKLASIVPERPDDDLRPMDAFDDAHYLASEAGKLREQIVNEPTDSVSDLLSRISLRVFWLCIPRWTEGGETRFSTMAKGIETIRNNWVPVSVNPNDLHKLLDGALAFGTTEDLDRLFRNGMDLNQTDYEGRTALHMCSAKGRMDAVQMLIARWASINAVYLYHGSIPKTSLDAAMECGKKEIVTILLENGAKKGSEI